MLNMVSLALETAKLLEFTQTYIYFSMLLLYT